MSFRAWLWPIGALLLCFGLLVNGATSLSLTYDEPSHLAAGHAWLARGEAGRWTIAQRGHPLLADAWAALPLTLTRANLDLEQLPGWATDRSVYARAFVEKVAPPAVIEAAGRIPTALLTILLGAVVARWASDVAGQAGGRIALAVMALDPTLLAHGRLATNDAAVTALGTLGLYLIWRQTRRANTRLAIAGGFVLGLTCLAKASGIIWCAVGLLYTAIAGLRQRRGIIRTGFAVSVTGLVALGTLWGFYGFSVGTLTPLGNLPLPAPDHWDAIFFQTGSAQTRLAYAAGRLTMGGWWWYFPLAFLLKNPLPLILASLWSIIYAMRTARIRRTLALPGLFALIYGLVAVTQGPNIGYRHMLPVHPILTITVATAVTAVTGSMEWRWPKLAALALYGWYAAGTLAATPNEIAYFNELAGPPANRHRYLISSNLNWGQMTKAVDRYLNDHDDEITYLAYTPAAPYTLHADVYLPPHPEGVEITAPFHPAPGLYLIDTTTLEIPAGCCDLGLDRYAYFRHADPLDDIGGAVLVYRVPAESRPAWLVQCAEPAPFLGAEALAQGLGDASELRHVVVDCENAWLVPTGGKQPGLYAVPLAPQDYAAGASGERCELLRACTPTLANNGLYRNLATARLAYRQPPGFILPPFVLYEATNPPSAPGPRTAYPALAGTPPTALRHAMPLPFVFQGDLALTGVTAEDDPGTGGLDVTTWWRVLDALPARPFSMMAHALAPNGATWSNADGLSVEPSVLRAGDLVIQRHRFEQPSGDHPTALWLRIGVYWLDDLSRWSGLDKQGTTFDAVFLPVTEPNR